MRELQFQVLPPSQRAFWEVLSANADLLKENGYYLAGGTGLALQLGHRESVDFDFFSEKKDTAVKMEQWMQKIPGFRMRGMESDALDAEIGDVKVSFIGSYKYPMIESPVESHGIRIASATDIGLMKLLAITHRATPRDYIDLATLFQGGHPLVELIARSTEKYGKTFNPMISMRALAFLEDLEGEMPVILDTELASRWKDIVHEEVRKASK